MPNPADRFAACSAFTLFQEDQSGFGVFENNPADPGGATRWGVTQAALSAWFGRPASVDEVRTLPRSVAIDIMRHSYWNPIQGDKLPPGVDLMVFDHGYNAGPGHSVRILQSVLGVTADGAIGPHTLSAINAHHPVEIVGALSAAQDVDYRGKGDFPTFGAGWMNRLRDRTTLAEHMGVAI